MTSALNIVFRGANARALLEVIDAALPVAPIRRVVVKPNWVCHQSDAEFPVEALVTSSDLVDAVVQACVRRYSSLESVLIGDIPIQGCDWERLSRQAGIDRLVERYQGAIRPRVMVRDLRAVRVRVTGGYLQREPPSDSHGDPQGYSDFILDRQSFLDPVSGERTRFRVADYSPEETASSHRQGYHRYRIARSLLDCDLFINMPKMKTHQKAGITGALKNLVGINGNKAFLVHYRSSMPGEVGDEYPPGTPWPTRLQSRTRQWAQQRSELTFRALQSGWRLLRRVYGLKTKPTREALGHRFVISGGSWFGNDSVWRMVYDLNRIILYGSPEGGTLTDRIQRRYLAVLDGLVAGEGNGPLQPLPVPLGLVGISDNPFLLDLAMTKMMGLDYRQIPQLRHHREFGAGTWGDFDPSAMKATIDGQEYRGLESIPILHRFIPPPGWRGHMELTGIDGVEPRMEAGRWS